MTLTACLINIIQSLGRVIVSVYLSLCLNHFPFPLVPSYSKAKKSNVKEDDS